VANQIPRTGTLTFGQGPLTFGQRSQSSTVTNPSAGPMVVATPQNELTSRGFLEISFMSDEILLRDRERFEQIQTVIRSAIQVVLDNRALIQQAIKNLFNRIDELNQKCQEMALDATDRTDFNQAYVDKCNFQLQIIGQVSVRHFETATQFVNMTMLVGEQAFKENQGIVNVFALERLKEVEILHARVQVLIDQENHEMQAKVLISNQQLKVEAQKFDQLMKEAKFEEKQRQSEFDRGLREREQKRLEAVAFEELTLKRLEINSRESIERLRLENDREVAQAKIGLEKTRAEYQRSVEGARISAEERVKMARMKSGNCTLF
jgi:hypothetical protein